MMILAHNSTPYGYLATDGVAYSPEFIARKCGCDTVEQYNVLLEELDRVGVPSRTPGGIIFSRRMVRDQRARLHRKVEWRQQKREQRKSNAVISNVRKMSGTMSGQSPGVSSSSSSSSNLNQNPESTKTVLSSVRQKKTSGLTEREWPIESQFVKRFLEKQNLANLSPDHQKALLNPDFWESTSKACCGIDLQMLETEFAKMGIWLMDNPSRRPTPRGIRRFVSSWLIRAYEKERRYGVPRQAAGR